MLATVIAVGGDDKENFTHAARETSIFMDLCVMVRGSTHEISAQIS